MILARGRFWRVALGRHSVVLELQKVSLPEELFELREVRFEVPLGKWNRLVKNVNSDRKLIGGLLLDFAKHKDRVSQVVGHDRLLGELRRGVVDATVTLVEEEILTLSVGEDGEES